MYCIPIVTNVHQSTEKFKNLSKVTCQKIAEIENSYDQRDVVSTLIFLLLPVTSTASPTITPPLVTRLLTHCFRVYHIAFYFINL